MSGLTACPLCGRIIPLRFPMHTCLKRVESDEYVNNILGMRLRWSPDFGWQSLTMEYDVIDDHTLDEVAEEIEHGDGWEAVNE